MHLRVQYIVFVKFIEIIFYEHHDFQFLFFFALSHRKHVCSCSEAVYGDARRKEKFMKTPRIDGSSLYIYIFIKAPPRGDVSLLSRCETCRLRRYSISITHLVALFNGHESPCVPKQNLNTRHVMLLA